MTDDQHPWNSDPNRGDMPPPVPSPNPPPSNPHPGYAPQPFPPQAPAGYQAYGQPAYGQPGFGAIAQSNSKATTSMVLGIVGLASIFFCYGILGIVLGPLAFLMGRSAQKEMEPAPNAWSNAGMAKAGWIMGLIQTILAIVAIIVIGALILWIATTDDSNF